jgi:uncharacterized membrane protein
VRRSIEPREKDLSRELTALNRLPSIAFVAVLTTFVVGWVSLNWFAVKLGYRALDPPPFAWLAGASSLTSLYLVI